ncbi:hypothetical protein SAMN02745229_02193 [Butyrivibrio fibrisolvens DSM 3071]|uniref:Uncharacterized protein n=1 Tax=Butyrivibrio fibrisolvens DSM 3071 TaxID=1121131 RepID=A0A1M5ZE22_BUTFI|nr:hypothetical protein [Butyrivibrio fibrisolvens]SHI22495.1 hypothetical protein SAMN02745229_02193 [Butyrivibrio fibrisolvens DSM 3071]
MKNIQIYTAEKYNTSEYVEVKSNIYKTHDSFMDQDAFVTTLSFEQEPEYEEGSDSSDISQYPLEDVLDKYYVAVSDFYEDLNDGSSNTCYLELSGESLEDIENLLEIVGKHVYNKEEESDGKTYIKLIIE